jgi:8-oxo-dGTP pyrophosphatase MutT (NUDIX family)
MKTSIVVTVAGIAERDGAFLCVEEHTDDGLRINQPAGRLEPAESILQAVVRETLEETAYAFVPRWLVGVYRWQHPAKGVTYLRFALAGQATGPEPGRALDEGILRALWLSPQALRESTHRHRSPLVLRCLEDYLAGRRHPLEMLVESDGH